MFIARTYINIKNKIIASREIIFVFLILLALMIKDQGITTVKEQVNDHTVNNSELQSNFGKIPMFFEQNKGQINDHVKFFSRGDAYNLFLTSSNALLSFHNSNKHYIHRNKKQNETAANSINLKMKPINANPNPLIIGENKLSGKTNYLIGSDSSKWLRNIDTYSNVVYKDIYSGIDLVYRSNQKYIEYDFVLAPGADEQLINLSFEGQSDLRISDNGNLNISFDEDVISFLPPVVYQETVNGKKYIESQYQKIDEITIGFELGSYDRNLPLIIDPELVYSTFIDRGTSRAIAVDSEGHVHITGTTNDADFYTTEGAFQEEIAISFHQYSGDYDAFVTKLNPEGTELVYSTFLGGSGGDDEGFAIALDKDNNAYITGITYSEFFPTTVGAFQIEFNKGGVGWNDHWINCDAFVTKLSADGSSLIYSTLLGGDYEDYASGIDIDEDGYAYVGGYTRSTNFPTTAGSYQTFWPGSESTWFPGLLIYNDNGFVTKLNKDGKNLIYSTYLSHTETDRTTDEYVKDIAVDSDGDAYVTGEGILSGDSEQSSMFIAKVNSLGSGLLYSTQLGNQSDQSVSSLAIDGNGNVYLTGTVRDANFPTKNAFQPTHAVNEDETYSHEDAFMMKINSDGKDILYSTFIGGKRSDYGEDIAVDENGKVYVLGQTGSDDLPTKNAFQDYLANENYWHYDYFITQIDPNESGENSLLYLTYLGGSGSEAASGLSYDPDYGFYPGGREGGIAVDFNGNAYITGETWSNDFPITENAFNSTRFGAEAIVSKIGTKQEILIYDQVVIPPKKLSQQILPQYKLVDKFDVFKIPFRGKAEDDKVALRVINTSLLGGNSNPIKIKAEVWDTSGIPIVPTALLGEMGDGNVGFQFEITQNGDHTIVVEAEDDSPGPFPAPFQVHLSGNIGDPKEIIDGKLVKSRGIRQDILFNHVAPRPQILSGKDENVAQTGLFKFVNPDTTVPYAVAVLVPSATFPNGLALGKAYKRAPDPAKPLDRTTPTAKTPACSKSFDLSGMVVDFTQLPDPPLTNNKSLLSGTVGALIGKNDNISVSLPLSNGIKSVILDMGSGQEIVNGDGPDFKVFADGDYTVGVSNSPFYTAYTEFFIPIENEVNGNKDFDLANSRLTSARYVLITASPSVQIDAVEAINYYMDKFDSEYGPQLNVETSTILMQTLKESSNELNPFLSLIGPEGLTVADVNGGLNSSGQNDDAIIPNIGIEKYGYYRLLGKGYDILPDNKAFGSFFVRLETGGEYDPEVITISTDDEDSISAQRTGEIYKTRQRDSYLVKAVPGQHLNIVVNTANSELNPMLEIFDPEGFMIGANDDAIGRNRNSALSINLPKNGFYSNQELTNPSTYRIVVRSIDGIGSYRDFNNGKVYTRTLKGGSYDLKVFTGELSSDNVPNPVVSNIFPSFAIPDLQDFEMIVSGYHFSNGVKVTFENNDITVKSLEYIHSNQILLTVDIASNANLGEVNFTVTNYDGKTGSGLGLFEIVDGIGSAELSWNPPSSYENLNQPTNLELILNGSYDVGLNSILNKNKSESLLSYNIYRSERTNARNNGKLIANTNSTETEFTDIIARGRKYYYQITAVYDQSESEPSNESSIIMTDVYNLTKEIPIEYSLKQNYPNPFNPITRIQYSIPLKVKSGESKVNNITLKIYDVLGKEVVVLVNQKQLPGNYEVELDASQFPSGIYFYRLTAEEFIETKKMVLLK